MSGRIIDIIAEALNAMPADARPAELVNRDRAAKALAALQAADIALVELPEPELITPGTDDVNGYEEWTYPHGSVAITDDGTIMWGSWHITDPSKVAAAGAALLAAAHKSEAVTP